jgi:chromate reductase
VSAGAPLRILGLSGSLRADSYNSRLLAIAARSLPAGTEYARFPGLKAVPPFDEDDEAGAPDPAVRELRRAIGWADGVLVATPEYNSSIPGQLKNAIDWASRPVATAALRNKNVAVIGASTGLFGAVWAQAELRKALGSAGARVLDRELAICLAADEIAGGELATPALQTELGEVVEALVHQARLTIELRAARASV